MTLSNPKVRVLIYLNIFFFLPFFSAKAFSTQKGHSILAILLASIEIRIY